MYDILRLWEAKMYGRILIMNWRRSQHRILLDDRGELDFHVTSSMNRRVAVEQRLHSYQFSLKHLWWLEIET